MEYQTDELLDVQDLLDMVYDHEVGCEHPHSGKVDCSVVVTARVLSCVKQYNVCSNIEAAINGIILRDQHDCSGCKNPVSACWRVNPI